MQPEVNNPGVEHEADPGAAETDPGGDPVSGNSSTESESASGRCTPPREQRVAQAGPHASTPPSGPVLGERVTQAGPHDGSPPLSGRQVDQPEASPAHSGTTPGDRRDAGSSDAGTSGLGIGSRTPAPSGAGSHTPAPPPPGSSVPQPPMATSVPMLRTRSQHGILNPKVLQMAWSGMIKSVGFILEA